MECYACANPATRQCRRCARVYCELHGGDLCAECLHPASSLPSFNLYRGSLLALLIGTAVALWLLVRPPGSGGGEEVIVAEVTQTVAVTQTLSTPTRPATPTLGPPTPTQTQPPPPTATPAPRTYTVQSGDSLLSIAQREAPPGVNPFDYAEQIASANGLSADSLIRPGQELVLP